MKSGHPELGRVVAVMADGTRLAGDLIGIDQIPDLVAAWTEATKLGRLSLTVNGHRHLVNPVYIQYLGVEYQ